jgi:acyl CoA:acetate/3-ketoacid CoA transferase
MDFKPHIALDLKMMDARLFRQESMGLALELSTREPCNIPSRLRKQK